MLVVCDLLKLHCGLGRICKSGPVSVVGRCWLLLVVVGRTIPQDPSFPPGQVQILHSNGDDPLDTHPPSSWCFSSCLSQFMVGTSELSTTPSQVRIGKCTAPQEPGRLSLFGLCSSSFGNTILSMQCVATWLHRPPCFGLADIAKIVILNELGKLVHGCAIQETHKCTAS